MPIASRTKPSLITNELREQIQNNGKIELDTPSETTPDLRTEQFQVSKPAVSVTNPAKTEETKGRYNDVANLHFSRGKKAEFKAFFSSHEVTLVQGVENAVNYIMKEVKAGRLTVSRNGIEKVGE